MRSLEVQDKALWIRNIGELITLSPLVSERRFSSIKSEDLGSVKNAWLLVEAGRIKAYGTQQPHPKLLKEELEIVDAANGLVLPGLVDSHTHPIFAGSRSDEFRMRIDGTSYQEIAAAGGGIKSTVRATREACDETILANTLSRLETFLNFGVTSVEAKTGYGLSPEEELRHLKILKRADLLSKQEIKKTCLALHATPPGEMIGSHDYATKMAAELLPALETSDLVDYVDAFIETGYFSTSDCEVFLKKAKKLGLGIRLHADEFSDSGGAEFAASLGAASADHLQFANQVGIKAMATRGVVATVLPGTSLYTGIPFADGSKFTREACPVAIASDFNPGSCLLSNLPLIASIAGIHCKLTASEVLAGITYVAAKSLGLEDRKGALTEGYDADLVLHPASSANEWLADMGQTKPTSVWIKGEHIRSLRS